MNELYNKYEELTKDSEVFYSASQFTEEGYEVISYTYRLASYTDFLEPLALECRGHAFIKDCAGNVKQFAVGFEKFFNYGENPFTEASKIDKLKPVGIYEKLDGSMILVGKLPNGELLTKTKTTINSEQAKAAQRIIDSNKDYYDFCSKIIDEGYTPIFEYTGPDNWIVVRYNEEKLVLLALRHMETGEYLDISGISAIPIVTKYDITLEDIERIQSEDKVKEGFVVVFENKQRVKFKNLEYVRRHRLKEGISNIKVLADLILNGDMDDVMSVFQYDEEVKKYIEETTVKIRKIFFDLETKVTNYYNCNKDLDRKSYAIKAKEELGLEMCLAMSLFIGREADIKNYIMKNELYKEN